MHCSQISIAHVDVDICVKDLPSMSIGCKQNQTRKFLKKMTDKHAAEH